MDEFQSEKEQIEEIKRWWKENGNFVVTGLVLGVLVLGGFKYWKEYRLSKAERGSAVYEQLLEAVGDGDTGTAADLVARLKGEFSSTPYATQGGLSIAALYVRNNEPEQAAAELRSVLETSDDADLARVARLRLARVLIMQDKAGEALTVLDAADAADAGDFAAHYHDVRGDAYADLGQSEDARREYQSALDRNSPALRPGGTIDRQFVEMKLNDLAAAEPEA